MKYSLGIYLLCFVAGAIIAYVLVANDDRSTIVNLAFSVASAACGFVLGMLIALGLHQ